MRRRLPCGAPIAVLDDLLGELLDLPTREKMVPPLTRFNPKRATREQSCDGKKKYRSRGGGDLGLPQDNPRQAAPVLLQVLPQVAYYFLLPDLRKRCRSCRARTSKTS
jgi:hypothetical protein